MKEASPMSSELSLSHDSESFLQQQVALGAYRDRTDAIEAGVELLRQRKWLLDRLEESQCQIRDGEYVDFDEEGLCQLFERLKERATKRAEAK
jgi:Arc/MetJ-type ribon-helix-helix transcriptional regulator